MFSTEGQINSGWLKGATSFCATAFDSLTGAYEGILVITTMHGALTARDQGSFNVMIGEFMTVHSRVLGGTGQFEEATGSLFFRGHVLSDGVNFVDDSIRGEICLDDEE